MINTVSESFKARNIAIFHPLMVTATLKANASQHQDLIKSFNMTQTDQIQSKSKKVTDVCNSGQITKKLCTRDSNYVYA